MKRKKASFVVVVVLAAVAFVAFGYYGNREADGRERVIQGLRAQWSWVSASKDLTLLAPNDDEEFTVLNMPVVEEAGEACVGGSCKMQARPVRSVAKRSKLFAGRIIRRVRCRN